MDDFKEAVKKLKELNVPGEWKAIFASNLKMIEATIVAIEMRNKVKTNG